MTDVGERAADLKPNDRIVCADGTLVPRVLEVRRPTPFVVDVMTHLRLGGPNGPRLVLHYGPDDRVDIVRI
ncbi:hypothetical protein [Streptomyces sp. NPDC002952]|uniref:hypothetical protein n=1 Tax=Streptomyces sp. NPDC002952 TaxID=3364673 RepID=UPI0036B97CC0